MHCDPPHLNDGVHQGAEQRGAEARKDGGRLLVPLSPMLLVPPLLHVDHQLHR